MSDHKFGEGVIRMNLATNFLIKQARRAQTLWQLNDAAIVECLERAMQAERHNKLQSSFDTARAIKPERAKS